MRILIIGEYSAFAESLRKGFQRIGHYCFVFSWGDVFKEIPFESNTYLIKVSNYRIGKRRIRGSSLVRSIISSLKLHIKVKEMSKEDKFDVVLIINPAFLKVTNNILKPAFSKDMIYSLVRNRDAVFLSSCGNDYVFNSFLPYRKKTNEYSIWRHYDNIEDSQGEFEYYMTFIHKVIPFNCDYAEAYRMKQHLYNYKVYDSIPLPYDTDKTESINILTGKIKILHGITRQHDKGSVFIISAMNMLKEKYPERVELIFAKQLTLTQYLSVMKDANIVIDQCYGCGYGMNAIEALAMGKVVLSGNEPENQKEMGCSDIPVVNIIPNVKQIFLVLEDLILNCDKIELLSVRSRKYAESVHSCQVVAQRYIETFSNNQ